MVKEDQEAGTSRDRDRKVNQTRDGDGVEGMCRTSSSPAAESLLQKQWDPESSGVFKQRRDTETRVGGGFVGSLWLLSGELS